MVPTQSPQLQTPNTKTFRLFSRYVALCSRHCNKLLGAFLLLCPLALVPTMRLELHTDLAELLPDSHPSALAMRRIAGHQKSGTNLVLIIESPDAAANRRFLDALRPELNRMIPSVWTEIQWQPDTEIADHAARWKWLYAEKQDLIRAEDLFDHLIATRKSPLLVNLEDDPAEELRKLRGHLDEQLPQRNNAEYLSDKQGQMVSLGIMLWRQRDGLASLGDHQAMAAVEDTVQRLAPRSFHPQMRVLYTGHIAMALAEQRAIRDDVTVATSICVALIFLSIYLYFRRVGVLLVIGAPALIGVLLALALARFTVHFLNINTAFLISIILGNGINTPIVLLARYGEERRRGHSVDQALAIAMERTLRGTATAMLAASIAYGCLLLTDFRGFSQFGLIGGAGMIFVWVVSFLFAPPLVIRGERWRPGVLTPGRNLWRRPFELIGDLVSRRPLVTGLCVLGLCLGAALPLARYARDPMEWDMRNLRSRETEPEQLWARMDSMGIAAVGAGYIGSTAVLLVDRPEQADPVAEALRKQDRALGPQSMLGGIRTLNSVMPKDQDEKLQILARLRSKIDKNRDLLSEEQWRELQPFRPPEYLRRLSVDDLPRQVRDAFTEVDGTRGRLIGIDAFGYSDNNGHDLLRLSRSLSVEALGQVWVAASASTVFAGMLEVIHRDGGPVMMTALLGVTLLICVAFGPRSAWPVLLALGVGMLWLGGLLGLLNLKLNFMNFVAVPITLGIGADYAANIWARISSEGPASARAVIADTGSAVALCSMTTVIGYSSLLLAHNGALRSFGILADLGELTCLLAALLVLPAIARILHRSK